MTKFHFLLALFGTALSTLQGGESAYTKLPSSTALLEQLFREKFGTTIQASASKKNATYKVYITSLDMITASAIQDENGQSIVVDYLEDEVNEKEEEKKSDKDAPKKTLNIPVIFVIFKPAFNESCQQGMKSGPGFQQQFQWNSGSQGGFQTQSQSQTIKQAKKQSDP